MSLPSFISTRGIASFDSQRSYLSALLAGIALMTSAGAMAQSNGQAADPAEADKGIQAITLSAGGVAEIHRQTQVDAQGHARLEVPLSQVDDILKSLLVRDDKGSLTGLTLDGLAPEEEAFRGLPFKAADLRALPRLAAALQGVKVRAASGGRSLEGVVLGVVSEPVTEGGGNVLRNEYLLSVMDDDGQVQALRLGPDSTLAVLDDKVRAQLRDATQAAARQRLDDTRVIDLRLGGAAARDIDVSYVVPAPVWKASYRLQTDGKKQGRLQGWAILENATGEDWRQVRLTLTSGAPVVLSQRLHERYWNDRPEVPVVVGAGARPEADRLAAEQAEVQAAYGESRARAAAGAPRMMRPAAAPPAPAPAIASYDAVLGGAGPAAAAQEGLSYVSFTLPQPVDANKGATVALPLLDDTVQAEALAVYRPGSGPHPVSGLALQNDTPYSLPPGLVTIYDASGTHAGDAELTGLPAGESRLLFFADDRKVTVREENTPQERIDQARIVDGVLTTRHAERRQIQYHIKGASDAPRTVLIEHPRQAGWTFSSSAKDSETANAYRLRASVAAGKSTTVEATEERIRAQTLALVDADADALLAWSGTIADKATAARLKSLAEARQAWAVAERREQELAQLRETAASDQARVRENLGAVPADSTLGQRYAGMLAQQEDRIAALDADMDKAREQTASLRQRFLDQLKQG